MSKPGQAHSLPFTITVCTVIPYMSRSVLQSQHHLFLRGRIHMMLASTKRLATVAIVIALSAATQSQEPKQTVSPLPRFEDYLVTDIFHGTPAAPHLTTPTGRMYRTVIREGVAKGIGVIRDGKEQAGPNFAGHYIVITWGCGSPCGMMAIEDALTGK